MNSKTLFLRFIQKSNRPGVIFERYVMQPNEMMQESLEGSWLSFSKPSNWTRKCKNQFTFFSKNRTCIVEFGTFWTSNSIKNRFSLSEQWFDNSSVIVQIFTFEMEFFKNPNFNQPHLPFKLGSMPGSLIHSQHRLQII